ncbi:hypothetical protein HMPREF3229_00802 [Peptoniphilus harei]|uniref:Uncharacterized protein n=1 Tax=Peptoniphilus harei TaxID=54005 RepID=A0A133PQB7_9FIRM|nr:hypothetical protein HMPREF3229_00802 [Peptoniphilus harei]
MIVFYKVTRFYEVRHFYKLMKTCGVKNNNKKSAFLHLIL